MNTSNQTSSFPSVYLPKPYEIQLKDRILGIAIGLTEWIQRELIRLQKNEQPRHCESYETLVEVIDDPTRFQMNMITNNMGQNYYSSSEKDYEDEETSNDEDADSSDVTSTTSETQSHSTNMSPPPTWLCKVFVELVYYCNRGPAAIHYTAPKLLLVEFEKIENDKKSGKPIDIPLFKKKLLTILFGKIQLTPYLVKSWKSMCEWVSNSRINEIEWLELSQNAYFIAQKLHIYETSHHQLQQQYRQKKEKENICNSPFRHF